MALYIAVLSTYPVMQQSPINFHFLRPSQLCHLLMGSLGTHFACHKWRACKQAIQTFASWWKESFCPHKSICKITRLWGAKSLLALDISSLNLVNLLVFIKSWKEMWKGLLYISDDHPCLFGRESPSRLKAVLGCKWLLSQHQLGLLL